MNVELGAGTRPAPGFLAVDLNPRSADLVADALHLPFADNTVDRLRAVDVLEHVSYRDTDRALKEWARVLRPGGHLYVQVPDAATIMRWYADEDRRLMRADTGLCSPLYGAAWRLLGGHVDGDYCKPGDDFRWNAHYALFSEPSLRGALDRAGLTVKSLSVNGHPNICCDAWKT